MPEGKDNTAGERIYASLIGPLRGLYYPLPLVVGENDYHRPLVIAAMLNTSKLARLWASDYDESEVDRQIQEYGVGMKLPEAFALLLDYDSYAVRRAGQGLDFEVPE